MRTALVLVALNLVGCTPADPRSTLATPPAPSPTDPKGLPSPDPPPAPEQTKAPTLQPKAPEPSSAGQAKIQEARRKAAEVRALFGEATKAVRAGKKEDALNLLDQVLEKDPGHAEAVSAKVSICVQENLYEEALECLKNGLGQKPDNHAFLLETASVLFQKGEANAALERIQYLVEKHPESLEARYLRARIHASLGDKPSAIAALQDAFDNGFVDAVRVQKEKLFTSFAREEKYVGLVSEMRKKSDAVLHQTENIPVPPDLTLVTAPHAPREGRPVQDLSAELQANLLRRTSFLSNFHWKQVDGKEIKLGDLDQKPVLIQFFGTWSPNSRRQLHVVEDLRKEQEPKGVAFLTLCHEPSAAQGQDAAVEESIRASLKSEGVDLPCVFIKQEIASQFGVETYPTTVLLAPGRALCLRAPGFNSAETLRALLEILLKAGPAPSPAPSPSEEKR